MITGRSKQLVSATHSGLTIAAVALLGAVWSANPALGQDRGEVTVDVEHCLDLESAEERQACFGAQVNEVLEGRDSGETEAGTADGENARETPNRAPAASEQPVAHTAEASDSGAGEFGEEYFGTIVEVKEYLPSAYIIRLDNGQIWEQTEPKKYLLRPGLEVRIYPTRWGNRYRLTGVDSGGHIQVRRLQ